MSTIGIWRSVQTDRKWWLSGEKYKVGGDRNSSPFQPKSWQGKSWLWLTPLLLWSFSIYSNIWLRVLLLRPVRTHATADAATTILGQTTASSAIQHELKTTVSPGVFQVFRTRFRLLSPPVLWVMCPQSLQSLDSIIRLLQYIREINKYPLHNIHFISSVHL